MSIYKDLIDAADKGKKFKVDLINKSLWIGRKPVITEGKKTDESKEFIEPGDLQCMGWVKPLNLDPWEWVEFLYQEFKHSVPSEHSSKRSYFKALPVDELFDDEIAFNIDRNFGIALLEGYILCSSLQGWLKWNFGEFWYWQSDEDPELVVLRNFVE